MDLEIIIKGGVELKEWYPKIYEAFEEKIIKLALDEFPGVGGVFLSSELTPRHAQEEADREKIKQEKFNQILIKVLTEPELLEQIRDGATASAE